MLHALQVPGLFGSTLGSAGPSTTDTNYDDAQTWIVQEFCDGGSLADLFLTGQGARAPKEMVGAEQTAVT